MERLLHCCRRLRPHPSRPCATESPSPAADVVEGGGVVARAGIGEQPSPDDADVDGGGNGPEWASVARRIGTACSCDKRRATID